MPCEVSEVSPNDTAEIDQFMCRVIAAAVTAEAATLAEELIARTRAGIG